MHGAASVFADQWMAALLAGERMARHFDDREFADWCAAARHKAAETVETRLWNGRYYSLADQPASGRKSDICFMDQFTYGTVAANILELGAVHPPDRVRRSLESIWQLNVQPCAVVARMGSNPDGTPADCTDHPREDGASQSNAFTPVSVGPYCAALVRYGLVAQGLELAERMAEIIIRRAQAPWSGQLLFNSRNGNWFYGVHYSDCLVIWDILYALLGVHINMWERRLSLAPACLPLKLPLFSALFCGQVGMRNRGWPASREPLQRSRSRGRHTAAGHSFPRRMPCRRGVYECEGHARPQGD